MGVEIFFEALLTPVLLCGVCRFGPSWRHVFLVETCLGGNTIATCMCIGTIHMVYVAALVALLYAPIFSVGRSIDSNVHPILCLHGLD